MMSTTTAGRSALLFGGTGAVGQRLLAELLASDEWSRVGEYGRRVSTPPPSPAAQAKLEQKVIDFEHLDEAGLKAGRWDVVFVTLGTTRARAGSAAQFEKIDREYVVRACKAAKTDEPTHEQRVVYLSSSGADPNSYFLYTRSKGLTERALAHLGYADTIVFRPLVFQGAERAVKRTAESILNTFTGIAAHFGFNVQMEVPLLAKSMARAGALGSSQLASDIGATRVDAGEGRSFTHLSNKAATLLGRA